MSAQPRRRRLPERAVLVELPGSAEAVEADPETLPAGAPVAAWRRWGWAVAFVPTLAAIVYQRVAAGRDWPVPDAVVVAATLGLLATALLALVRYQDDRSAAALDRGREALLTAPVRTTGTLTLEDGADGARPQADGAQALRGTLVVTPASGEALARPVRVVVPAEVEDPRSGDPVAVWHAAQDEDATGVLLVRYHRAWADDLVAALRRPADEDAPPSTDDEGGPRAE